MEHIFVCLHCQEPFVIRDTDFNCRILRHGAFKATLQQIPPHATKEECDALVRSGTIYGCAGPLQIVAVVSDDEAARYKLVVCDYI